MTWRLDWNVAETVPSRETVLRDQGFTDAGLSPRIGALVDDALERYVAAAEPRGLVRLMESETFLRMYAGEGRNLPRTPLPDIATAADRLALFVCTAGPQLTTAITDLFARNEPAKAYMLDVVASLATDALAFWAGRDLINRLDAHGDRRADARVLPYSPGYCGWHITGQRALFAALAPETIGVTLNESCLMTPLKSVSGVLVVAPVDVHAFHPDYACCEDCATRHCEDRTASLRRVCPTPGKAVATKSPRSGA